MWTVLVVDDEYDIVEVVGRVLSSRGYEVDAAINGKLALAALQSRRPDVILLDVTMPVMTGIQLLRTIKSTATLRDIPVLMMSAVGDDVLSTADASLTAGYLRKPFTLDELMAALAGAGLIGGSAP
jgi:two-component system, sensor histidine kinase and response regulator